MMADDFIITCEHGGNRVPVAYRHLFEDARDLLATHRGYDPGALAMARALAASLAAPLLASTVSRLVIDLNRSIGHPQLYSPMTRAAPQALRRDIVERHYRPYRERVEALVDESVRRKRRVIHVSSHSFTPELDGRLRNADIGLLYDPGRAGELRLCRDWQAALAICTPALRVRRNYPYAGKSDGLTCHLRRRFSADAYIGIELEINQRVALQPARRWSNLRDNLINALRAALHRPQRRQGRN